MKIGSIDIEWEDFCYTGTAKISNSLVLDMQVGAKDEEKSEALHPEQIENWIWFESNQELINSMISDAIYDYYLEMRPKYVAMGGEWANNMPAVDTKQDVMKMVYPSQVAVSYPYDGDPVQIGILCGCDWDSEHGLGIILSNCSVADVGGADIACLC